jgi:hypothetical protein
MEKGLDWDKPTQEKFERLIEKMPFVLRGMAKQKVGAKAHAIAQASNHLQISEKDMVDAFFAETPFGFQGLMKNDLIEMNIDYTKYGYPK